MQDLLSSIHWVSFGLGFSAAAVVIWVFLVVTGWLRNLLQPPSSKPFGQRLAAALRNVIGCLLGLIVLALAAYIVYWVAIKPAP